MKKILYKSCAIVAALSLLAALGGCGNTSVDGSGETPLTISDSQVSDLSAAQSALMADDPDLITSDNAATVTFSGDSATVDGGGASVSGGTVNITSAGTYTISGTSSDGQIYVEAKNCLVTLVLDGTDISCSYGPAVMVENAGKVVVELIDGSENILSDTLSGGNEDTNACLFSRDTLLFTGSGTLTVNGNYEHGIFSKDGLSIESGSYIVSAVNDGIKGKDYLVIYDGSFTINAGGDCLRSNNDTDEGCGFITVYDGEFDLTSSGDGIQAESDLTINAGSFNITSGSGAGEFSASSGDALGGFFGNTSSSADSTSCKGIKSSGGLVSISGGTFNVDSEDDSIHSNVDVTISGGTFTLASGDDGIHADGALTISGGEINVTQSYEGLEGNSVTITGGKISLLSSDDGINAAGGADSSGFGGFMRGQQDTFTGTDSADGSEETDEVFIRINGGEVYVDAYGDGIDSNGSIYIEGGNTIVNGPTNSGNGAIDAGTENGGNVLVSGGTILAIGAAGMDESFDSSSEQTFIRYWAQGSEGSEIVISDSTGNVVYSYTAAKSFGSVIFSSPELSADMTYTVTVDGSAATEAGESTMQGFNGGGGKFGGGSRPDGTTLPEGMTIPDGATIPDGMAAPDGGTMPDGTTMPDWGGQRGQAAKGDAAATAPTETA